MSTWAVSLFPSLFDETGTDGLARYQAIDSIGFVRVTVICVEYALWDMGVDVWIYHTLTVDENEFE